MYMRGGTSKGVFFRLQDLPEEARVPGPTRDALLLRIIGSPDPYCKHTDGMGGATSSTSKTVIISKSDRADYDVDYLFGQVAIDKPVIDWSGNCGNLTAAVGAFAIHQGLIDPARVPEDGICTVRIWQSNIGKSIRAHVPMRGGCVQEDGDFILDGVTFPAAEVRIDFLHPADADAALFPTGQTLDTFSVPDEGSFKATFINAGIPTIFVRAEDLGFDGTESQLLINGNDEQLSRLERIRAHGALKMGLIENLEQAQARQHTPKLAWIAAPRDFCASSGAAISQDQIDLNVRAMSMGQLHHAMMGTAAVAIASAVAIPGTLLAELVGGQPPSSICFGHPSGTLRVGALATQVRDQWVIERVSMSRSARVLMEGHVWVP